MNTTGTQPAGTQASRPSDLPDFERPPVTEVILSMQFATLANMKSVHIGLLWERFRAEYPDVSEQAPITAVFETFGTPSQTRPVVQLEQFLVPPMPRYWFEKRGNPDLLQVQQDRLIHNWRKQESESIYPRYEKIRERFRTEVDRFVDFLNAEKIGELKPNQCEVTYVNIIQFPDSKPAHDRFNEITPLWANEITEAPGADFEDAAVQLRFRLVEAAKPIGRVHVAFQPAVLASDPTKEVFRLDITARGRPKEESITSAFEFFDYGRRAVVKMFAAVTTEQMHSVWGRTDAGDQRSAH